MSPTCIDFTILIDNKKSKARLLKEIRPYQPDINGQWGVNPISILTKNLI